MLTDDQITNRAADLVAFVTSATDDHTEEDRPRLIARRIGDLFTTPWNQPMSEDDMQVFERATEMLTNFRKAERLLEEEN
jgi:hypothetical protein